MVVSVISLDLTCVKTHEAVLQDKQGTKETGRIQLAAAREAI